MWAYPGFQITHPRSIPINAPHWGYPIMTLIDCRFGRSHQARDRLRQWCQMLMCISLPSMQQWVTVMVVITLMDMYLKNSSMLQMIHIEAGVPGALKPTDIHHQYWQRLNG